VRIIQLSAENVKRISAIEIAPDGNLVQITGKNGAGKTSVLDAIWWGLGGKEAIQSQPIRKGEKTARIEIKLGDGGETKLIVERRFTETDSYLHVKAPDGARYPNPQRMLDDLLGTLTFDPLAFMRAKPSEQLETLRRMVPLDVDMDALDRQRREAYEARTDVQREAKGAEARAAGMKVPEGLPDAAPSTADLLARLKAAHATNSERTKAERLLSDAKALVRLEAAELADAEKRLKDQQARCQTAADKLAKAEAAPLPEFADTDTIAAEIAAADQIATGVRVRDAKREEAATAEALRKRADELTAVIDGIDKAKADAISRAPKPIEGLGFGDGAVTFNGLPLNQASDAEQLRVSTAIAAAMNPKLRVIRIRDGSLLDDDAKVALAAFADKHDLQIWMEVVDSGGKVGIVMEDGHVRGQEPKIEAAA